MTPAQSAALRNISLGEFVVLIAAMMAMTALSIDIMLPALPAIADAYNVLNENDRQMVVTAYVIGFGLAQLVPGPISDRFGRKSPLLVFLLIYAVASVLIVFAPSFEMLLLARFVQGIGSAGPRVVALAVVRDCFSGRHMARIMSYVIMVFIIVPVIAPSIGGALLLAGHWQWIFWLLFGASVLLLAWSGLRLPETRAEALRLPISVGSLVRDFKTVITNRVTLFYTIGTSAIFGCMLAYINSAQQIYADIFGVTDAFPLVFGAVACVLAVASFLNGRLVERLGMRLLGHGAVLAFILIAAVHLGIALTETEDIYLFCILLGANFLAFGFIMANFNAMAMEPVGRIGGTASSFIGCVQTCGAGILGYFVGQAYNGTVVPLLASYVAFGVITLIAALIAERGRLFAARWAPPNQPLPHDVADRTASAGSPAD
ncbi:multidrug effflux MFS transporter [Rhodoligotrophos defluvii]|uniref:multidrug effflux MFS transporter n=1 Tax=Rhodoligotrophos defluvii TaxID=2561934 RepID=UPI0010C9C28B|nr:multidrug effflux MFS transporter [Rhodoligotrophos defluvii]